MKAAFVVALLVVGFLVEAFAPAWLKLVFCLVGLGLFVLDGAINASRHPR